MPRPAELPESIRALCRINAIELSDQRWSSDIERLATVIRELEAQQEARAQRRPGTIASPAGAQAIAATPTMKPSDVNAASVHAVVASLPNEFRTKDVSEHPHVRGSHPGVANASNYHAIVGRYLSAHHVELSLAPPQASTDDRGAVWRKITSQAVPIRMSPAPAFPTAQQFPRTASSGSEAWVGWLMVALPLVSCGFLAFVPSIWVAVTRRAYRRLMVRALATAGLFLTVLVVAFALIGTSPTDEDGTPIGASSNIGVGLLFGTALLAALLAIFQRDPSHVNRSRA
jgi:hypothetical protein